MKALSIKQPWAWMIAKGHKTIETRTWATKYRGDLLIAASKGKMTKVMRESFEQRYPGKLKEILYGQALATCRLVDCRPMTNDDEDAACCDIYDKAESWVLKGVKEIESFYVNGQLSLYEVKIPKLIKNADGQFICHCKQFAAVLVGDELLCWWHWLGPQGYKTKFNEEKFDNMKAYQESLICG